MKKFVITIDTEGDNLWVWREGNPITTNNTKFLRRFQDLCNSFSFKPTWLTNYEMIMDDAYLSFIKEVISSKTGELGAHLHAWNNPPIYKLDDYYESAPYLIEYPDDVMEEKLKVLTDALISRTGVRPVSHRAGRWAMNSKYFELLAKYGYKFDCSYTPYANWTRNTGRTKESTGSNYSKVRNKKYVITTKSGSIYEYPTSILKKSIFHGNLITCAKSFINLFRGKRELLWVRPNGRNLEEMLKVVEKIKKSKKTNYLMFMIHSSELMPGGSPTFPTEESIENLYKDLEVLFKKISNDFVGSTLSELGEEK